MSFKIHIGCCGWSYLNEQKFPELRDTVGKRSKLQAYAGLFDTVEINSTFYRLPRLSTAEKWRKEADEVNPDFEFTVKAFKGITHLHRFQKNESLDSFDVLRNICSALRARCVLFQSPASFKPSPNNIENMRSFFDRIDRRELTLVWEPRGAWYEDPSSVERVCEQNGLVHCVDPFRNAPLVFGKARTAYFRLHGFGTPTMYRYDFSRDELARLRKEIDSLKETAGEAYVFFNNEACYKNGMAFCEMENSGRGRPRQSGSSRNSRETA